MYDGKWNNSYLVPSLIRRSFSARKFSFSTSMTCWNSLDIFFSTVDMAIRSTDVISITIYSNIKEEKRSEKFSYLPPLLSAKFHSISVDLLSPNPMIWFSHEDFDNPHFRPLRKRRMMKKASTSSQICSLPKCKDRDLKMWNDWRTTFTFSSFAVRPSFWIHITGIFTSCGTSGLLARIQEQKK